MALAFDFRAYSRFLWVFWCIVRAGLTLGAHIPHPGVNDEMLLLCLDTLKRFEGNQTRAASHLGLDRSTFRSRLSTAIRRKAEGSLRKEKPFTVAQVPEEQASASELLDRRKKDFARTHVHKTGKKLVNVGVRIDGPIGIVHFGDPHVDDDGTDIGLIEEHVRLVNKSEGLFGANLGDIQNNWVGRLARLYAEQSTSHSDAWVLTEWLVSSVQWIYLVAGNHDCWSGVGDPLRWIAKQSGNALDYHGVRLNLKFPNAKQVRINARHDFAGHSMWNPAHGPMKAVQGGWRDHILTCGHKHVSFVAGPLKDPASGLLSWSIRCAGYKTYDRYAEERGLPDQNAFAACVTIIDPQYADDDARLITVIPDVHEGADYLKFKRKKAKL